MAGLHVADPGRKGAHDDSDALANAAFQTALEVVDRAGTDASDFSSEETFRSFTDASGLDRATVALDSVGEDLISLSEAYSTSVACTVPSTIIDPIYRRNPVQAAAILQERYGLNARPLKNKPDTVKRSLAFACEQLAVDLAMSSIAISDRLSSRIRAGSVVDTAPSAGLAILPPTVEYHFFRPSGKSTVASTGTEAARALLSEWTLGADPRVRPPYVDPYKRSEQTHEVHQRTSNPFRDRITKGGQISASQPAPRAFAASAISVNRSPIIPTATILPSDVRDDRREAQPPSQGRSTPPVRALPPQSVSSSQPLLLTSPVPSTQVCVLICTPGCCADFRVVFTISIGRYWSSRWATCKEEETDGRVLVECGLKCGILVKQAVQCSCCRRVISSIAFFQLLLVLRSRSFLRSQS